MMRCQWRNRMWFSPRTAPSSSSQRIAPRPPKPSSRSACCHPSPSSTAARAGAVQARQVLCPMGLAEPAELLANQCWFDTRTARRAMSSRPQQRLGQPRPSLGRLARLPRGGGQGQQPSGATLGPEEGASRQRVPAPASGVPASLVWHPPCKSRDRPTREHFGGTSSSHKRFSREWPGCLPPVAAKLRLWHRGSLGATGLSGSLVVRGSNASMLPQAFRTKPR
mmetsp:Transcript_14583/g.37142  ORF Transcript_14583/g.37142 Transcript_14583/m.37142 type:complete len:223 (+) Transcript_14583:186-854(+)